jgi:hypothetical protein
LSHIQISNHFLMKLQSSVAMMCAKQLTQYHQPT